METKHTKGEWRIEYLNWPFGFNIESNNETICILKPMCYSSSDKTYNEVHQRPENKNLEANVKLIAAAPDLLESLLALKDRLNYLISTNRVDINKLETIRDINIANEAIKKATK